MIRIKKILYPTDFSSYSNQAYFHAIALAENHNASLTVLFVYNPDSITTPGSQGDELADRRYWQEQLESIRPVDTRIPVTHVLLEGDPRHRDRPLRPRCRHRFDRHGHARPYRRRAFGAGQRRRKSAARCIVFGAGGETAARPAGHDERRCRRGGESVGSRRAVGSRQSRSDCLLPTAYSRGLGLASPGPRTVSSRSSPARS